MGGLVQVVLKNELGGHGVEHRFAVGPAALAGVGGGMGYQKLVQAVTGVALAKGETRSDWLRRPLSASQLEYAADDVRQQAADLAWATM
ncbi:MAG TPA: hypothetical protein PK620_14700, partial [Denitromonas sp.]|nr:hypothetical protein [Denitromonas sp.]